MNIFNRRNRLSIPIKFVLDEKQKKVNQFNLRFDCFSSISGSIIPLHSLLFLPSVNVLDSASKAPPTTKYYEILEIKN